MLLETKMADTKLKKELRDLEDFPESGEGDTGTVRLYGHEWYMVTWIVKALEGTPEEMTAAELLQPMIGLELKAKFDKYREKIQRLLANAREHERIKRSSGQSAGDPQDRKRPKK